MVYVFSTYSVSPVQIVAAGNGENDETPKISPALPSQSCQTARSCRRLLGHCSGLRHRHRLGRLPVLWAVVMNKDEIFELIKANGLTLHGDIEHFAALVADRVYAKYMEQPVPSQTGVISITIPEPVAYLCENAVGHKYFRWKKPSSVYKPIALYTKAQS